MIETTWLLLGIAGGAAVWAVADLAVRFSRATRKPAAPVVEPLELTRRVFRVSPRLCDICKRPIHDGDEVASEDLRLSHWKCATRTPCPVERCRIQIPHSHVDAFVRRLRERR